MGVNIPLTDIEACLLAIEDGYPQVAAEILTEYKDEYLEELENESEEK